MGDERRLLSDDEARRIIAQHNGGDGLGAMGHDARTDDIRFRYLTGRISAVQMWTEMKQKWLDDDPNLAPGLRDLFDMKIKNSRAEH